MSFSRVRALVLALVAVLVAAVLTTSSTGHAARGTPKPSFINWPMYHGSAYRAGYRSTGPAGPLKQAWSRTLQPVNGEPLIVGSTLIVATQNDQVYGLDATTGKGRWKVSLGTPARLADLSDCGYLDPVGIISTPAYDHGTGTLFVAAETTGGVHTLWALDATNGKKKWHRNLDLMPAGYDKKAVKNRAALLVAAGRVFVSFGSVGGDCGNYVGYVTSTPTNNKGATTEYNTPSRTLAGMWSPAGAVLGRNGSVYQPVGEGAATSGAYDGSMSVLELDPKTLAVRSLFAPSTWASDNANDLDLGSSSPAMIPSLQRMVIAGKRGTVYLLPEKLGGVGSEIAQMDGCMAYGGTAVVKTTVILNCQVERTIRSLTVSAGSMSWGWTAPKLSGAPVVAGDKVYVADRDSGDLVVLNLADGSVVQRIHAGTMTHFPSEVVDGGYVFVPTMTGVVAFH